MKNLKKYIKEEISKLIEKEVTTSKKYEIPPEIQDTLEGYLKMKPLIRYVDKLKAVNTIPPSYRVFLLNGETFDIYYETFSLMIKIKDKEYYIGDLDERNYAIKHINKLLTDPLLKSIGKDEEGEETGGTPPPTPPPSPPAEEPEA